MTTAENIQRPDAGIPGSDCLSCSSCQAFLTCPRLYYWQYEIGWRPDRTAAPLRMGSAVHLGIDLLARGTTIQNTMDCIAETYGQEIEQAYARSSAEAAALELERETVACLVAGYAAAWGDSQLRITESERTFDVPIVNPATGAASRTFRQVGKRDRLAVLPDGRLSLLETKTVGVDIAPDSDYWRLLAINHQVTAYILAARAEGHDVSAVIYDVIRKPTIRPTDVALTDEQGLKIVLDAAGNRVLTAQGKVRQTGDSEKGYTLQTRPMTPAEWAEKLSADIAERPGYYYQRREIGRLDADIEEYRQELWQIAVRIRESRNAGHWFRNSGACKRYSRLCDYYPLCSGQVDISNGVPAGFRQAVNVHEELEPENGEG